MFSNVLGIRLQLMIGKDVPRPASYEVMNAFRSLQVTNSVEPGGDGFQLSFTIGKNKQGEYSLLHSGDLDPDSRVVIGVWMGAKLEPLIDGVIYNHQVSPGEQPGTSTLTISGRDISIMLDLKEIDEKHAQQPDSSIVQKILQNNYAQYGIIPPFEITTTTEIPTETERIPRQHETDLKYIQRLAERNSFVFYIEPVTMSLNKAHWGPEKRTEMSQPALSYDLGPSTNVKNLSFMNDALAPINTDGSYLDPVTKTSNRIPELSPIRLSLTAKTSSARRTERLRCTAYRKSDEAQAAAKAAKTAASEPISAEGELETLRYGSVLRPRRKVGVRGVGRSYNGDYFVQSVTHRIERGIYTQTFKLRRDGTGAASPKVRTNEG